jgi:hypothetical protein
MKASGVFCSWSAALLKHLAIVVDGRFVSIRKTHASQGYEEKSLYISGLTCALNH